MKLYIFLICYILSWLLFCQPNLKKQIKLKPIELELGTVFKSKNVISQTKERLKQEDFEKIWDSFFKLLSLLEKKELDKLTSLIKKDQGLYVDLKAHWSYQVLKKEIQSRQGYLYDVLLNPKDEYSVCNILRKNKIIYVDFHIFSSRVELQLYKPKTKDFLFGLHNPMFIKSSSTNDWYVYRLL